MSGSSWLTLSCAMYLDLSTKFKCILSKVNTYIQFDQKGWPCEKGHGDRHNRKSMEADIMASHAPNVRMLPSIYQPDAGRSDHSCAPIIHEIPKDASSWRLISNKF